jgi:hypothetical protein
MAPNRGTSLWRRLGFYRNEAGFFFFEKKKQKTFSTKVFWFSEGRRLFWWREAGSCRMDVPNTALDGAATAMRCRSIGRCVDPAFGPGSAP